MEMDYATSHEPTQREKGDTPGHQPRVMMSYRRHRLHTSGLTVDRQLPYLSNVYDPWLPAERVFRAHRELCDAFRTHGWLHNPCL